MITQTPPPSWLTITMASLLLIAACTAKLQSRSNETDNATATSTTTTPVAPTQSAKADEPIDTTLTLEKLRWKNSPYSVEENEYRLDTSITNHLPHFNAQELFTYYRFLFDLGEDDSMVCPRCNDTSYVKSKAGVNFEYNHYYKGIYVLGRYINLQTDDHLNIERINVNYKRIKYADVTPQMSVAEAAKKAGKELIDEQRMKIEEGEKLSRTYHGTDLIPWYRGLMIIPQYGTMGGGNRLVHVFWWYSWQIIVYDKGNAASAHDGSAHP